MGQKCSCLNNKEGEKNTIFFQPSHKNDNEVENDMFAKAVNPKGQNLISVEGNSNLYRSGSLAEKQPEPEPFAEELEPETTFPDHLTGKLVSFQSLRRGYLQRVKFNDTLKRDLQSHSQEFYQKEIELSYTYILQSVENKHSQFDKNGWNDYYKPGDMDNFSHHDYPKVKSMLNVDYGKTLHTQSKVFPDDTFYSGDVNLEGKRHGYGMLLHKNGMKYCGYWYDDYMMGWGRLINETGEFTEALFLFNKANGRGVRYGYEDSFTYKGTFLDGMRDGKGFQENEQFIYEGDFKADIKCGKGTLKNKKTNDFYEGEFADNAVNGTGHFRWENQHSYCGTFLNGKMHGFGTYKWKDGAEYTGDYLNNIKEGNGTFKWPNGKSFRGKFVNGNPHGIGMMQMGEKEVEVEFINGKMNMAYKKVII